VSEASPLKHVLLQVAKAGPELRACEPELMHWDRRAEESVRVLVPWLIDEAAGLKAYTEEVLNSPSLLRESWSALRGLISDPVSVSRIDRLLANECVLLEARTGDTVSLVVTRFLVGRFPGGNLEANGKSDYPDLFIKTNDYSQLPRRKRGTSTIGAAVCGRRPVRVPDGLEIKTSRNQANIDCHYAHAGMHLLLAFSTKAGRALVDDVLIAFLRMQDYRICKRNTEATTVKASFTRAPFISLFAR